MIDVLISVDHKMRDLPSLVLIAKELKNYNLKIDYCRNNVIRYEINYLRPKLVVIPHLLSKKNRLFFQKLSNKGLLIIIYPTEGIPTLKSYIPTAIGKNLDLSFVQKHLLWNEETAKVLSSGKFVKSNNIIVNGTARFDFYYPSNNFTLESRRDFFNSIDLDQFKKTISVFTNFTQAQFYKYNKDFFLKDSKDLGYGKFYKDNYKSLENITKSEYLTRDLFTKAIINLIKNFPNINIIFKPHPSENHIYYFEKIDELLTENEKQRIRIITDKYVFDIIKNCDFSISRSCLTAVECWMLLKPTINLNLNPNDWYVSKEHEKGSEIARTEKKLKILVSAFLNGKKISISKKKYQNYFIKKWTYKFDGKRSIQIAKNINEVIKKSNLSVFRPNLILSFFGFIIRVSNYRIHDLKLYGLINYFRKNNLDKLGRTNKYYNFNDVKYWEQRLSKKNEVL